MLEYESQGGTTLSSVVESGNHGLVIVNLPGGTHISRGSLKSIPKKYINETSDCNDEYNVAEQTIDCS